MELAVASTDEAGTVATGASPIGAPARADGSCGGDEAMYVGYRKLPVSPSDVAPACMCDKAVGAEGCLEIGKAAVACKNAAASPGGREPSEKAPGGTVKCACRCLWKEGSARGAEATDTGEVTPMCLLAVLDTDPDNVKPILHAQKR